MREPTDETVAAREVSRAGRGAQGKLANERARARELMRQLAIARRVDTIGASAHYRKTGAPSAQTTAMGGGIDPKCEPAHDREARVGNRASECLGIAHSLRGGVPAANDRERWRQKQLEASLHVEGQRRIGNFRQAL